MSRKPLVFLNGRDIALPSNEKNINNLKDFIDKGGNFIDGDILLGKSDIHMYYKKELVKLEEQSNPYMKNGAVYDKNIIIPKNISESFSDLMEIFGDSMVICNNIKIYLKIQLHKLDKTYIEIETVLGRKKFWKITIEKDYICIYLLVSIMYDLKIPINVENKIDFIKKSFELMLEPRISTVFIYKSSLIKIKKDIIENQQCIYKYNEKFKMLAELFIDKKIPVADHKYLNFFLQIVTGPQSIINRKISNLSKEEYLGVEIIAKTEPNMIFCEDFSHDLDFICYPKGIFGIQRFITTKYTCIKQQSQYRKEIIIDTCIAFASLVLPSYVLLEIVDWLPVMKFEKHIEKINWIISINKSIKKIKENRN